MKRQVYAVFLIVVLFLTGCDSKTDKDVSSGKTKSVTQTIGFVTPMPGDRQELQKKYPEWFDQNGDIVYPVTVGSDEMKAAKTHQDRTELLQIPKEIVDTVDSETLLKAVEAYPLLDFSLYDSLELGLEQVSAGFYGMETLLKRKDAYRAAISSYRSRGKLNYGDGVTAGKTLDQMHLEEYLISRPYVYENLTEEERKKVLEMIHQNSIMEKKMGKKLGGLNYEYGFEEMIAEEGNPWKADL